MEIEIGDSTDLAGTSGIYFLLKGNEVVYIGKAKSPKNRIRTHQSNKNFDQYIIFPVSEKYINTIENNLILLYQPKLNKVINTKSNNIFYLGSYNPEVESGYLGKADLYVYRGSLYARTSGEEQPFVSCLNLDNSGMTLLKNTISKIINKTESIKINELDLFKEMREETREETIEDVGDDVIRDVQGNLPNQTN